MISGAAIIGLGVSATLARGEAEDYDQWQTYDKLAAALYLLGTGAVTTGAILYAAGRPSRSEPEGSDARPSTSPQATTKPALQPFLAPGGAGAALSTAF